MTRTVKTDGLAQQMQQQQNQKPAAPQQPAGNSIAAYLKDNMKAMGSVLPKHMTPERMARIALSEIRKNPSLRDCTVESLGSAIMQSAALGLEPGPLGHVHYVPFNRKIKQKGQPDRWVKDVQFIIGYKGYIDLATRSGELANIKAMAVHENDFFDYEYGSNEFLKHKPADQDRGQVVKYYAYANLKNGGFYFAVWSREAILEHAFKFTKQQKEGQLTGVWRDNFDSMAKKTVIRELIKFLPMSIEYQEKFSTDEKVIKKVNPEDQDNIFDMEYVDPEAPPVDQEPGEPVTGEIIDAPPIKRPENMTDEEAAAWEKDLAEARKAQAELDKKKGNK